MKNDIEKNLEQLSISIRNAVENWLEKHGDDLIDYGGIEVLYRVAAVVIGSGIGMQVRFASDIAALFPEKKMTKKEIKENIHKAVDLVCSDDFFKKIKAMTKHTLKMEIYNRKK